MQQFNCRSVPLFIMLDISVSVPFVTDGYSRRDMMSRNVVEGECNIIIIRAVNS